MIQNIANVDGVNERAIRVNLWRFRLHWLEQPKLNNKPTYIQVYLVQYPAEESEASL